jgi:tRNA(fMet)-specific endonuclease VapC
MMVLDTDVCIEILRENRKVIEKRKNYSGELAVSFMTIAELRYGADYSGNPGGNHARVSRFLKSVQDIASCVDIADWFGKVKASLKRKHLLIPDADILVAATALSRGMPLVTGNTRHFSRIDGLALEDWTR